MQVRRHLYYSGTVQGVGFRYAAVGLARGRAVAGFVRNLRDGRVELVVEGEAAVVAGVLADLEEAMRGYVGGVESVEEPPTGEFSGFRVSRDWE